MTDRSRPAAEAGLTLLDQTDPGWWRSDRTPAIDPDTLNVGLTSACPVGQLYPAEGYEVACARLGRPAYFADAFAWELQHGLTGTSEAEDVALSGHWRAVIINRRAMPGIANFADNIQRRRLAEWAQWSSRAPVVLADPPARWVELTGQGVWWGPFTTDVAALEFAQFVTAEIDPATAEAGPPPAGVHRSDPVAELLSWRCMKLAES